MLGSTLPDCNAALEATSDRSVNDLDDSFPPSVPIGVRFAATIKIPFVSEHIFRFLLVLSLECRPLRTETLRQLSFDRLISWTSTQLSLIGLALYCEYIA